MPAKGGPLKEMRINYRVPPGLVNQFKNEMEKKGFSDRSELVTVILRQYFDKEKIEDIVDRSVRAFLESEEGMELVKDLVRKAMKT